MNDILIRKVKYEDIEQIVDICIHDWQVEYKGIIDDKILENLNKKEKMENSLQNGLYNSSRTKRKNTRIL